MDLLAAARRHFLGLAQPRIDLPCLVERDRQLGHDLAPVSAGAGGGGFVGGRQGALDVELGQQLAVDDLDVVPRRLLVEFSGDDVRIAAARQLLGLRLVRRQTLERGRAKFARRLADDIAVDGARRYQVTLGLDPVRRGAGKARFGLGDVGAGDFADLEAVAGRLELTPHPLLVLDVEFDHRLVAEHVYIGPGAGQQHALLDRGKPRPCGADLVLRPGDLGRGAAATVKRLGNGDLRRRRLGRSDVGRRGRAVGAGDPGLARQGNRRAPVGECLGHGLVDGAQARPLGQQCRIVVVGLGQCLIEGVGEGRARSKRGGKKRRHGQAREPSPVPAPRFPPGQANAPRVHSWSPSRKRRGPCSALHPQPTLSGVIGMGGPIAQLPRRPLANPGIRCG